MGWVAGSRGWDSDVDFAAADCLAASNARSVGRPRPASAVAVSPGFQGRVWCGWLPICLFYPLLPLPAPSDMDPIAANPDS